MKTTFFGSCIVALALLSSCATYHFEPISNDRIEIKRDRNITYPVYLDPTIGMILSPSIENHEIMLRITVRNNSSKVLTISDTDFAIYSSNDRVSWKPLKMYTSTAYYKKEHDKYVAGAILMVLDAAANSASAGYGTASTNGNIYGHNSYGSYSGAYSSTTRYYDPEAAELANQRNAAAVSNYAQNGKAWLSMLKNNLFYSKDLEPNEIYFGIVFSKFDSSAFISVICKNENIELIKVEYTKVKD